MYVRSSVVIHSYCVLLVVVCGEMHSVISFAYLGLPSPFLPYLSVSPSLPLSYSYSLSPFLPYSLLLSVSLSFS